MFWAFFITHLCTKKWKNKWWNFEKMPKTVFSVMKKYKVQLEKFKKFRFSSKNRLFKRLLESSHYKNQFFLTNEQCFMVHIAINNVFETTKYKEKVRWKSVKTLISAHFRLEKKFSQKSNWAMFWALLIPYFLYLAPPSDERPKTSKNLRAPPSSKLRTS